MRRVENKSFSFEAEEDGAIDADKSIAESSACDRMDFTSK
jgi:hypothetical protein